jgi:hypothetical protein
MSESATPFRRPTDGDDRARRVQALVKRISEPVAGGRKALALQHGPHRLPHDHAAVSPRPARTD